ncbi:MAG TPA: hypothetical protein VMW66_03885 [Elusimicrobiales bacterium]|nr:hypothetical protein [Elusimicrobiales bacterium]
MAQDEENKFLIQLESVFNNKGFKEMMDALGKIAKQLDSVANTFSTTFNKVSNLVSSTSNDMSYSLKQVEEKSSKVASVIITTSKIAAENSKKIMEGWSKAWDGALEKVMKGSTKALGEFFNFTKGSFLELGTLTNKLFNSILDSFFNMVGEMASSSITNSILGGGGTLGASMFGGLGSLVGSGLDLLGFRFGGSIPKTGPYMLHAGEYILPSEVVDSIRTSQRPPLSAKPSGTNFGGNSSNMTLNQTVNIQSSNSTKRGLNIRDIATSLKQASKEGMSWAVDLAKVNYKIGKAGQGEISL